MQGASSFLDIVSSFTTQFPVTALTLNGLADVSTPDAPNLNDRLGWNGVAWVNVPNSNVGAGT